MTIRSKITTTATFTASARTADKKDGGKRCLVLDMISCHENKDFTKGLKSACSLKCKIIDSDLLTRMCKECT